MDSYTALFSTLLCRATVLQKRCVHRISSFFVPGFNPTPEAD
jgi:hypothetical protein